MQNTTKNLQALLLGHYQWFHRHPELSLAEYETTARIRTILEELGIEILDTGLQTGLVALIRGALPGKTVALRADIDALPVSEDTAIAFPSENAGVMHACGHDFHITALLGAAMLLKQSRNAWRGAVKLIFQPAEEHSIGALRVIQSGALSDVAEIYAQHVMPMMPSGAVALRAGANHAAVGWFRIQIDGCGGHAAMPHACTDPIVAMGQLVGALQTVVSRSVNPFDNAVVSVTHVSAGNAWNVIPSGALVEGTFRVFSDELAHIVSDRIARICRGIAESSGTQISLDWKVTTAATNNSPELIRFASDTARALDIPIVEDVQTMVGEDFAEYQKNIPGVFLHFGVGGENTLHHPAFLADATQLSRAAQYLSALASGALERLNA